MNRLLISSKSSSLCFTSGVYRSVHEKRLITVLSLGTSTIFFDKKHFLAKFALVFVRARHDHPARQNIFMKNKKDYLINVLYTVAMCKFVDSSTLTHMRWTGLKQTRRLGLSQKVKLTSFVRMKEEIRTGAIRDQVKILIVFSKIIINVRVASLLLSRRLC